MDIAKTLDRGHSKKTTTQIVDYIGSNKARFKVLIDLFFSGPYRTTQRAAWPLGIVASDHPALIKPYLGKLIRFMQKDGVHDAVKRNGFRILQFVDIPKKHHGELTDLCFRVLQDNTLAIAIRVFAMTVLSRIIEEYPELKHELRILIEDELPYAQPAFRSRGIKVLKALDTLEVKK